MLPKVIFKIERWKWNGRFGVYASNLGNFRNNKKMPLKQKVGQGGYLLVKTKEGYKLSHRVVMDTWNPIDNFDEMTVDHLDHNKRCNELTNLEWVTFEENQKRSVDDYLEVKTKTKKKKKKVAQKPIIPSIPPVNYIRFIRGNRAVVFTSYESAKDWLRLNTGLSKDASLKNIEKAIVKSFNTKAKYHSGLWEICYKTN